MGRVTDLPFPNIQTVAALVSLDMRKTAIHLVPAALALSEVLSLGRANGEKGNRALALVYADQNRNLDRALELIRGELETRKDVYTYDALSWVLFSKRPPEGG